MNIVLPDKGMSHHSLSIQKTINLCIFRFRSKQSSSGSSSIGVIRTDSDVFDGMLFDGDSRGSSVSLNSTCSARSHQEHNLTTSSNLLHDDTNANG